MSALVYYLATPIATYYVTYYGAYYTTRFIADAIVDKTKSAIWYVISYPFADHKMAVKDSSSK